MDIIKSLKKFSKYSQLLITASKTKSSSAAKEIDRSMASVASGDDTQRFCTVDGYDGRTNDLIYSRPFERCDQQSTVVYFGGDMQDFPENMESHRDSKHYLQYNLEETAKVLRRGFPQSHIVVVRPSKIEYKTFSCFKNFVPSNNCGAPEFTPMHHAIDHLAKLLINLMARLKANNESTGAFQLINERLILIGFSKGTVVLNQFLYEFHHLKTLSSNDHDDSETSIDTINRIREMYWLDGGHSGGKNTWITSKPLLETLSGLGIIVHIDVSPYQIEDDRRPWIRREEKAFGDTLRRLGASVQRTVHFANESPNLHVHFGVLNAFKSIDDDGSLKK